MAELECGGVVEQTCRLADRLGDRLPPMSGVHAPETRTRVEQCAAGFVVEIHALGTRQHARTALEVPVRRKGKPEGRKLTIQPAG